MTEIIPWPGELMMKIYNKSIEEGFRRYIIEMTLEAYKALENGYCHSPVILAGETLHRVNCEFILWYAKSFGKFKYKKVTLKGDDIFVDLKAAEMLLDQMNVNDSIAALRELKAIDDKMYFDMHALRYLRNRVVHSSRLPRLDPYNEPITTREELEEALSSSRDIPLKWRKHQFQIRIDSEVKLYIVDQERLEIDVDRIKYENRVPTIALALLFSSMKHIYEQIFAA